jgi:hypothetical protein
MATYDTKIGIVVRNDLATWQKLNVACFLTGGLAGSYSEIVGEPYQDADARAYLPLVRQPVLIFGAERDELTRALRRAQERDIRVAIYTEELFGTYNDIDNRAAVAAVPGAELNLVGLGLHADRRVVDKILKDLRLLA